MQKNKFRLLKAHGTTIKVTGVKGNKNYANDIIRIQAANGDEGFFKGPEIPVDHLNAFIGHLQDIKAELDKQKSETNPNSFTYDDEIPSY
jgi:hypothetical protein